MLERAGTSLATERRMEARLQRAQVAEDAALETMDAAAADRHDALLQASAVRARIVQQQLEFVDVVDLSGRM